MRASVYTSTRCCSVYLAGRGIRLVHGGAAGARARAGRLRRLPRRSATPCRAARSERSASGSAEGAGEGARGRRDPRQRAAPGRRSSRGCAARARRAASRSGWCDDLNPDGAAARTRQNAHGVDLNRNFPYRWRPRAGPSTTYYPGPRALPSPSRRPPPRLSSGSPARDDLVPPGTADRRRRAAGGDPALERLYARRAGCPAQRCRLPRHRRSLAEPHASGGDSAFVVELPGRAAARRAASPVTPAPCWRWRGRSRRRASVSSRSRSARSASTRCAPTPSATTASTTTACATRA